MLHILVYNSVNVLSPFNPFSVIEHIDIWKLVIGFGSAKQLIFIVEEGSDGGRVSTHWTVGPFGAKFERPERPSLTTKYQHTSRIIYNHQPKECSKITRRVARKYSKSFKSLQASDDTGHWTADSANLAIHYHVPIHRDRIQATVAGCVAVNRDKSGQLSVIAKGGAGYQRFSGENSGIVGQVSGYSIVRSVYYEIVLFK